MRHSTVTIALLASAALPAQAPLNGPMRDAAALTLELQNAAESPSTAVAYDLEHVEREHIRRVLAQTGGNKTLAATLLGIGLTTLYAKLKKWGM